MKMVVLVVSVLVTLLGGLWLVQGLGLVKIDPIACVADCEPVTGPVLSWAIAGAGAVAVGVTGILWASKRMGSRRS